MIYALTVLFGLVIVLLLHAQLRNEAKAQKKQVENMFGNLALCVYCPSEDTSTLPTSLTSNDPSFIYPIISTSITCGRKDDRQRYQIDLPIETVDEKLMGTAAVFTVEPSATGLALFVRCLEQPYVLVRHKKSFKKGDFETQFEYNLNKAEKQKKRASDMLGKSDAVRPFTPPRSLENDSIGKPWIYKNNSYKIRLSLGDEVWLGNTVLKISRL